MQHKKKFLFILAVALFFFLEACQKEYSFDPKYFPEQLSDTDIFSGNIANLTPSPNYHLYELSSGLFSDYSEKQRLIKLPTGTQLTQTGYALPDFPDGTTLVKTFYYWNDERDTTQGKKIVETRLLVLNEGEWQTAVYQWNTAQTEAYLLSSGANLPIHWINKKGEPQITTYHIPNLQECLTCHQVDEQMEPTGFKLHNLNRLVKKGGQNVNQLAYFQTINLINQFDWNNLEKLPSYKDHSLPDAERSRAYMDINCAHCHSPAGMMGDMDLDLRYYTPIEHTGILSRKDKMLDQMASGYMPLIGTSLVDQEYIDQTIQYLNSL